MDRAEDRIVRSASALIRDDETLLVSGSRLTRSCAPLLRQTRLTIITNDLGVPAVVAPGAHRVYVRGGQYEPQTQSTIGPLMAKNRHHEAELADLDQFAQLAATPREKSFSKP